MQYCNINTEYSKTCLKRPLEKKPIQSNLFITSLIIKEYSISNIKLLGTDRSLTQFFKAKIVSEYDQEILQSQTADYPVAPRGRAAQPSRDIRKTN